ncbi:ABC transporter permease [Streptococcus chenjunshii]|uniref:Cell division protein FtsX n=1 Tax=Streptococcus chenjunshii TaxID=2173853 RepID=A0A372KLK6_9STRE|nr:permease-like cell division protein FtsX [Streptococcus chenjunshii]AXQ79028.1 ABC transporter permease [Streptococcus chenjunshii]RFU51224.1 ABC transporter permease [Streptococcus chenjunshii]RFU53162.1 ABC transporter permease [Streptococcus chenjunshii]
MIRNFFHHLWESMKSLKRNFWMTLASVSSVTITLTLLGIFGAVLLNTERLASGIENNIQINTYLEIDSTDNSEMTADPAGQPVANENYHKVYDQIMAISGVKSITFSSKDEQLKQLQDTYGDDWALLDGDSNPLQDVYVVEAAAPEEVKDIAESISGIEGVESVDYGGSDSDQLFRFAALIRTWGLVGTGLLVLVAIFLISNTIRITIISRRRDIEIMRLVGAKNSYIRGPFFFEGAWVGFLGAIIPSLVVYFLYQYVYRAFSPSLELQSLSLYDPGFFLPSLIGLLFLIGIVIGSIGSMLSMRRYLKF